MWSIMTVYPEQARKPATASTRCSDTFFANYSKTEHEWNQPMHWFSPPLTKPPCRRGRLSSKHKWQRRPPWRLSVCRMRCPQQLWACNEIPQRLLAQTIRDWTPKKQVLYVCQKKQHVLFKVQIEPVDVQKGKADAPKLGRTRRWSRSDYTATRNICGLFWRASRSRRWIQVVPIHVPLKTKWASPSAQQQSRPQSQTKRSNSSQTYQTENEKVRPMSSNSSAKSDQEFEFYHTVLYCTTPYCTILLYTIL